MLINETALDLVVKQVGSSLPIYSPVADYCKWYDAGWQVNIHAIGDRANRAALDAFEGAIGSDLLVAKERRMRVEHAQIIVRLLLAPFSMISQSSAEY